MRSHPVSQRLYCTVTQLTLENEPKVISQAHCLVKVQASGPMKDTVSSACFRDSCCLFLACPAAPEGDVPLIREFQPLHAGFPLDRTAMKRPETLAVEP